MSEPSLQERLVRFLIKSSPKRIAKGEIEDLARANMGVTAETVGRRLRILREVGSPVPPSRMTPEHESAIRLLRGGSVEVEYRDKNHAFYYYIPPSTQRRRRVEIVDGVAKEIYETVNT